MHCGVGAPEGVSATLAVTNCDGVVDGTYPTAEHHLWQPGGWNNSTVANRYDNLLYKFPH
jgi:hypothetical protein